MTLNYQTSLYSTTQPLSPLADEQLVIACLSDARPRAMLWSAKQSLVVPRSYKRFANFAQAAESMRLKGWPVYIRQSGGGSFHSFLAFLI